MNLKAADDQKQQGSDTAGKNQQGQRRDKGLPHPSFIDLGKGKLRREAYNGHH